MTTYRVSSGFEYTFDRLFSEKSTTVLVQTSCLPIDTPPSRRRTAIDLLQRQFIVSWRDALTCCAPLLERKAVFALRCVELEVYEEERRETDRQADTERDERSTRWFGTSFTVERNMEMTASTASSCCVRKTISRGTYCVVRQLLKHRLTSNLPLFVSLCLCFCLCLSLFISLVSYINYRSLLSFKVVAVLADYIVVINPVVIVNITLGLAFK